jgi:hypothetical protein
MPASNTLPAVVVLPRSQRAVGGENMEQALELLGESKRRKASRPTPMADWNCRGASDEALVLASGRLGLLLIALSKQPAIIYQRLWAALIQCKKVSQRLWMAFKVARMRLELSNPDLVIVTISDG